MEPLGKIEKKILTWTKDIPQLPLSARKWLGENIWWIVLIVAIISGISALALLNGTLNLISVLGTVGASFYAVATVTSWGITVNFINLAFIIGVTILLAVAVKPLQLKQKKGWVLLFAAWLLAIVSAVVSALLSFNIFNFIIDIIFAAIWVAISGYFIFEVHGQFAHVQKSKGVKAKKA